jgi:hypothetical protein
MGNPMRLFGDCDPWDRRRSGTTIGAMTSLDPLRDPASALVEAAHAFHRAAETRGRHAAAHDSLASLQEALQVLSAAWYRLAADAVPGSVERNRARVADSDATPRSGGLSREQEVRLTGALHDVAAAFARCARACREGRSTVTPVIAGMHDGLGVDGHPDGELSWFASSRPPTEHVG